MSTGWTERTADAPICEHVFHVSSAAVLPSVSGARVCTLCDHYELLVGGEWLTLDEYDFLIAERPGRCQA